MKPEPIDFDPHELERAVATILSQPFDQAAADRVQQRALQIPLTENSLVGDTMNEDKVQLARIQQPRSNRWTRLGSIVASLAATILLVAWLTSGSASNALALVVEQVMQIRTLQFAFKMNFSDRNTQSGTMMIRDDVVRFEQSFGDQSLVSLINSRTREALIIDSTRKLVQKPDLSHLRGIENVNPIAELIAAKDKSVKSLGSDRIDDKPVSIYSVRGLRVLGIVGDTEMTLWVDNATQLPVKIEMFDSDPKSKIRITFDHFNWNADLPAERFAMTVPDSYQTGTILVEPSSQYDKQPSTTQDLSKGILLAGRVPSRIDVDQERAILTALIRDQENAKEHWPNELRQWNLATGELRWQASVGGAGDLAVCHAMDLLVVVQGQEIQLRKLSTGETIKTWASDNLLGEIALSADGTRLAHGYTQWSRPAGSAPTVGGIEIWNIETGKLEQHIQGLDRVDSVEFSPSGESLLVCSSSGTSRLYNSSTAKLEYSFTSYYATFSPDGKSLAMVAPKPSDNKTQGSVELMDLETKVVLKSLTTVVGSKNSYLLSLSFSNDGKQLVAGDWNGTVSVWDMVDGQLLPSPKPLPAGVHRVRFTKPHGLAIGCEDATLRLQAM